MLLSAIDLHKRDLVIGTFWCRLSVFQTLRQHSQGKRLGVRQRLFSGRAVGEDAG